MGRHEIGSTLACGYHPWGHLSCGSYVPALDGRFFLPPSAIFHQSRRGHSHRHHGQSESYLWGYLTNSTLGGYSQRTRFDLYRIETGYRLQPGDRRCRQILRCRCEHGYLIWQPWETFAIKAMYAGIFMIGAIGLLFPLFLEICNNALFRGATNSDGVA